MGRGWAVEWAAFFPAPAWAFRFLFHGSLGIASRIFSILWEGGFRRVINTNMKELVQITNHFLARTISWRLVNLLLDPKTYKT